ncbi:hypothetical protein BgiBS90_015326 [Biomphalaria glabrata]|nr:hypothetical protein BgiBS90_015326 [Biomphalaria glabrata]
MLQWEVERCSSGKWKGAPVGSGKVLQWEVERCSSGKWKGAPVGSGKVLQWEVERCSSGKWKGAPARKWKKNNDMLIMIECFYETVTT